MLAIALIVGVVQSLRTPIYYPHVVVTVQDKVKIDLLHQGRTNAEDCQSASAVIADIVRASCPTCQVTLQKCSNKLEDEYKRLLSEEPVGMPTFPLPNNGVAAFNSTNAEVALLACQETERLTAKKQSYRATCYPPNTARTRLSSPSLQPLDILRTIVGFPTLLIVIFVFAGYFVVRFSAPYVHRISRTLRYRGLRTNNPSRSQSRVFDSNGELRTGRLDDDNLKRIFDVVFALSSILISLPLFLLVPLAIKVIDWRCPILVHIKAVGKGGRSFRMHKFSTMVRDADKVLAHLLARDPAMRYEWEQNHKLTNDPRLLPLIGKFLRKYSINELPQFFNVLKGEMAVVGPRPISREEEEKYVQFSGADLLNLRHSIRPGITGLWQISGRNNITYRERVLIDTRYLQNRSWLLDLRILLKTVAVVVRGTGAY